MPFSAGELCCSSKACVLLNTGTESSAVWDKIPHVTEISYNLTANTPKLVTSSTNGKETSACGTVTQSGTLAIACHKGTGPGLLNVNKVYHIVWAEDCDSIWNAETCVATSFTNNYYEALIRITTLPVQMNISGNQASVNTYSFDIVSWILGPDDYEQTPTDYSEVFGC